MAELTHFSTNRTPIRDQVARQLMIAILILTVWLGLLVPALPARAETTRSAPGPSDPAEVQAFFDGLIGAQMGASHIAGVAVIVVKDGKVLFEKGYGYSDVDSRTPVDPEKTLFRAGSVSKLFTWTAVMQLVEQGRLDLNTDINAYLKEWKIPATYPQPITLANLMAHTAGFEDKGLGAYVAARDYRPLGDYLKNNMPARVRPPGEISAYSNYGAALAGYVVEQISGIPFEQYIDQNIFTPLGMAHSTFHQPAPLALAADQSQGYRFQNGLFIPQAYEYSGPRPAAAMAITAGDMGKFLIAHLHNGRLGDARILQEATAIEMHTESFSHDPRVSGFAHGFIEKEWNGQKVIWHGGDYNNSFHSAFVLLPEHDTGFFIAYNSEAGATAKSQAMLAFIDHYYPAAAQPVLKPDENALARYARFTGSYANARSNYTTSEKALGLLSNYISVSLAPDGYLMIDGAYVFAEVAPGVFRDVYGQDVLVFQDDAGGNVQYMFASQSPTTAYIRLPGHLAPPLHLLILGLGLLLFALTLLAWPIGYFARRALLPATPPAHASAARLAHWLARLVSALNIGFVIGFVLMVSDPSELSKGIPGPMMALLWIPAVSLVLSVGILIFAILGWKDRYWPLSGRICYTLAAGLSLVFTAVLAYWGLLIPRL
jgi:CubicO group peptidase (beta-lactamase class C family)